MLDGRVENHDSVLQLFPLFLLIHLKKSVNDRI